MRSFVNKILDVPKLILRVWIILWLLLVILLVMKLCFNIWYPIVVENQTFVSVCNYIDNNRWLSIFIMCIFYEINSNILFLTCMGKKKYSKWYIALIFFLANIGFCILKVYFNFIGIIIELSLVALAIGLNVKFNNFKYKNHLLNIIIPIAVYGVLNLWQFTIYFVRGLNLNSLDQYPSLIYLILQIDYYIFTIITWIGVSYMGLLGVGWLWKKDVTELKALREKEVAKAKPDNKLIAEIDKAIAEKEKQN